MRVLQFPSQYKKGETPYELFKDRMGAISSIVSGIKGIILNKYDKGVMDSIIGQIEKARTEQEATDMINLLTTDPTDIYPDDEKLNTIAGKFIDYANLAGKEKRMGMPTGEMSQISKGELGLPGVTPTSEIAIPQMDKMQLLEAIRNMPEGQMDFAPVLKYMEEHRPGFMGSMSSAEQWVMNQAMGQIGDPREKLSKDMGLAQQYLEYSREPEEEKITNEIDFFRKDPQGFADMMRLKQQIIGEKKTAWEIEADTLIKWYEDDVITVDELKKGMGIYIPPEKRSEFDKKFELAKQMNLTDNEWKKFFGVWLGEEGEESKVKYYDTSAECVANAPKIEGMTIDPTLDKTKGWYPNYVKETIKDPKDYLFTKKNMFGEISNIGIIPTNLQEKLSFGQPLTEEEKNIIRNNHNLQKSLLDEKMLAQVEAILKMIGIPLGKTPEPPPVETDPYAGLEKKWWEFWEGVEDMSEDQLKEAVMKGNPKAIEEAKKRGYIK